MMVRRYWVDDLGFERLGVNFGADIGLTDAFS
jgi:hypothetical protein